MILFVGCADRETAGPQSSAGTPVIVISVDTLRSDRLPAYGYTEIETPAIDLLREEGVLYQSAYTHVPLTFPAHASLFTGRLPAEAGVRDNVGYRLDQDHITIAEIFGENGYRTGAAVSAFVLREELGLGQGFDAYDDEVEAIGRGRGIAQIQRIGGDTVALAKQWIADNAEGPFFYFLHLYDPHTPYAAPEPFSSRYERSYDNEIAYVDSVLGDFFEFLEAEGIWDEAMIVFLSDHGEGLGDHGEEEHGVFLYREAIQIPLIVKLPGSEHAGKTVHTPVQIIDLFPTLAGVVRADFDLSGYEGRSLIDLIDSPPAEPRLIYSESYYPQFHFGWSDLHSLVDGKHHYIHAPEPELYDLETDFPEKENQLEQNRRVYFEMSEAIEPLIREADAPAPVDPEEAAKLAALGYLGSAVETSPEEDLPDPKHRIESLREVRVAFTLFGNDRFEEALGKVDEILAENERMFDMWDLRSKILGRLGRNSEAIASAKKGLELVPNARHLMITIASLNIELGNLDQAELHAELALESQPAQANELLARIALERGDLERAERLIGEAEDHSEDNVAVMMTRARVQNAKGNHELALDILDRVLSILDDEEEREVRSLHFIRGDVLARMGRAEEAEIEFRKEIRLFPHEPQPYKNLVLLLVTQDRLQEATGLLRQLIETAPTARSYLAVCRTLEVLGDERGVRYWARRGLEKFPNEMELRRYLSEGMER
ncbi:MAG: sulfatase-like hydrolase/transferase [Thermoanaerobaculia bacterium]|nr:sulfatase-like hydrolase/transferase [Thermoanaerobaculia bacterium]